MPKIQWLHYAENRLAPLCRKPSGSITPTDDRLYSSHLADWRRQRERGELAGLSAKRGRKPEPVNPLAKRVAELEREKRRLERKLEQAELLLDIQKKASRLLEIPLRSQDDDGSA